VKLQLSLANTFQMQLICDCCGQPYYPSKSWQDNLEAVALGTERYAICPVCTQAPPEHVFTDPGYRRRCRYQVQRLQALYEFAKSHGTRGRMRKIEILYRGSTFALAVDGLSQNVDSEADLLRQLVELGISQAHAEDAISRLKATQKLIRIQ
jgi:hypothetical protein